MKENVDIDILVISRRDDRKIMQPNRIRSRHPWRIRKWNELGKFRLTYNKIIHIEKTYTGYILTIYSPVYPFLQLI